MAAILCFGSNFFGQLGIGEEIRSPTQKHEPVQFGKLSSSRLVADEVADAQCGSQFTVVLKTDGSLLACGSVNGKIMPILRKIEIPYPLKCVAIACGRKHTLILMEGGYSLSWGTGHFGQLGHGDDVSWDVPKLIQALEPRSLGSRVVSLVCGGSHSGAQTETGQIFMWGLNKNGQCGILGHPDSILEPKLVEYADKAYVKPLTVVCGRNHSALLTTEGRLYAWGSNTYGRLGISTDSRKNIPTPTEVSYFHNIPIHSIASGDFHMLALTHDCSLYSWGYGADGQLGHLNFQHSKTPRRIEYFDASMQIIEITCGAWWSMALSKNGCLYGWGYSDDGFIGIPKPAAPLPYLEADTVNQSKPIGAGCQTFDSSFDVLRPQRIRTLSKYVVNRVRSGSAHTLIFCSLRRDSDAVDESVDVDEFVSSELSRTSTHELTALLFAWCRHKKSQELEYALSHGADVNTRDSLGNTPLMVACQNGHMSVAALLIKYGANVTVSNKTGNTALHYCFAFGFEELGNYLISKGADEFVVNNEGMTCYEGLDRDEMDNL